MDAYDHSKSRWTNSNKRSGKKRKKYKYICHCTYCENHTSREIKIHKTERDLETEFLHSSVLRYPGGHERSAKEFVEWFYSPLEEEPEANAMHEGTNEGDEGDLEREVGEEVYRELVRENLLAQEQLDRQRAANLKELETFTEAVRREMSAMEFGNSDEGSEGDWDLVSTASLDETAYFEDWEEVTAEL
jgi:hypothetical protein